ncbi:anti-sigma factor domain-containing protein [Cryobacterium adonitolivorans]|uniref:anti-sigma factor domain-containing protein n=1 Tax=Cryobacterium adonitolivorans TaxID=1259189 RepID=UPI001F541EF2|nr:anti-sigma factor [Cryobacterium adonitolivorans]
MDVWETFSPIAQAQRDALPGWAASGNASVAESADGRREVVVDLDDDAGSAGLREVWLLTADATGLVSVGLLDGSSGRFSIPAGIDLAEYPVVDVPAEPADGNPAHSGDSIVRGTLSGL